MHLYGESRDTGEAFKVNQWNGVDVVINGTLQHGIVVGISAVSADGQKHGLLIDFNCPQRHSEFAEYGNIFSCPDTIANPCERWTQVAKWAETHPLQALIRVGADRAWTWWPVKQVVLEGTLRRACCNEIDCELVEVQWGDAVTKELIPLRQVRCVPSPQDLQQRRVGPDYFVSRECRLPKGYWSAPPGATRRLWQDLSRGRRACCVAVRTDSFTYFQRNSREIPKLSLDGVESAFSDVIKSGFVQHSHGSQGDGSPEGEWDGRRFVPPSGRSKAQPTDEHPDQTGRGIPVPREIMAEVLQSLDTFERVGMRRVCRLWDLVLDADAGATGQQLWISCRHRPHKTFSWAAGQFLLASCLLKSTTTDTIILEDSAEASYTSRGVYGMVATLLQQRCIKRLILSRHDFGHHDCHLHVYLDWMNQQLTRFAATCQVVVWRECRLSLVQVSGKVAYAKFCLREAPSARLAQLWEVCEKSLVEKQVDDLPGLAE